MWSAKHRYLGHTLYAFTSHASCATCQRISVLFTCTKALTYPIRSYAFYQFVVKIRVRDVCWFVQIEVMNTTKSALHPQWNTWNTKPRVNCFYKINPNCNPYAMKPVQYHGGIQSVNSLGHGRCKKLWHMSQNDSWLSIKPLLLL